MCPAPSSTRSKFFSKNVDSDTSSSSSSFTSSEDEGDWNITQVEPQLVQLCESIESQLKISPITSIHWNSIQRSVENIQKCVNENQISNQRLIEKIGRMFISLEDSLQTAKTTGGGAGSAGMAAKQASLFSSRLPMLKPSIITPSLLSSLRESVGNVETPRSSSAFSRQSHLDSESDLSSSYSSSAQSSESEDDHDNEQPSRFFKKTTTSASDKWKKKDTTPATTLSAKKQPTKPKNLAKEGDERKEKPAIDSSSKQESLVLTPEAALKRYVHILATRGRKGTDRQQQIQQLEEMISVEGLNPHDRVRIKLTLLSYYFERTSNTPIIPWMNLLLNTLLDLITLEGVSFEELAEQVSDNDNVSSLFSSLLAFVIRADDEFNLLLLTTTAPSSSNEPYVSTASSFEYCDLLHLERPLYCLIVKTQALCAKAIANNIEVEEAHEAIHRLTARRLSHLYAKSEKGISKMEAQVVSEDVVRADTSSISKLLAFSEVSFNRLAQKPQAPLRLAASVLLSARETVSETIRAQALLYLVSWIANEATPPIAASPFLLAKGLLLASSLSETIFWADVQTQVLYNRSLALLGLAAFREGRLKACMVMLGDLVTSGRSRELLGQYFSSSTDFMVSSASSTMIPWYLWISLESLEMTFLLSSSLIEIPQSLIKEGASTFSKLLRRVLSERSDSFISTASSSRDIIAAIDKYILIGDWKRALTSIESLRLPFTSVDMVSNVKRAAMLSLLGRSGSSWTSLSVSKFAEFFELPENETLKVVKLWAEETRNPSAVFIQDEKSKWWLYAHERFSCSTVDETKGHNDIFAQWAAGLQLAAAAQTLTETFTTLNQESDKLCSKRHPAASSAGTLGNPKHHHHYHHHHYHKSKH